MRKNVTSKHTESGYTGNCVIYTRTTKKKGRDIAAQMHDCLQIAEAVHDRTVKRFRDKKLEYLFGFCFDPKNKISSVIIAANECLTRDEGYYKAIEDQFALIGIELISGDDIDGGTLIEE